MLTRYNVHTLLSCLFVILLFSILDLDAEYLTIDNSYCVT